MICYRDTSYCTHEECALFPRCLRALTESVWLDAARTKLPISMFANGSRPPCFVEKDGTKTLDVVAE